MARHYSPAWLVAMAMPRNRQDWPGMWQASTTERAQVKHHLVFAAVVAASFGRRRPVRSAQWLAELLAASLAASMACSASIRSHRRRRYIVAGIISGIHIITTVTDTRSAKTRPRRPGRSVSLLRAWRPILWGCPPRGRIADRPELRLISLGCCGIVPGPARIVLPRSARLGRDRAANATSAEQRKRQSTTLRSHRRARRWVNPHCADRMP
jgi:hypothetical protein